jgi:hypothetical protein
MKIQIIISTPLFNVLELLSDTEMLSGIEAPSFKKLNPSGAPLLPNLLRYQALAVCYTAARLLPCIFGKRGACRF